MRRRGMKVTDAENGFVAGLGFMLLPRLWSLFLVPSIPHRRIASAIPVTDRHPSAFVQRSATVRELKLTSSVHTARFDACLGCSLSASLTWIVRPFSALRCMLSSASSASSGLLNVTKPKPLFLLCAEPEGAEVGSETETMSPNGAKASASADSFICAARLPTYTVDEEVEAMLSNGIPVDVGEGVERWGKVEGWNQARPSPPRPRSEPTPTFRSGTLKSRRPLAVLRRQKTKRRKRGSKNAAQKWTHLRNTLESSTNTHGHAFYKIDGRTKM